MDEHALRTVREVSPLQVSRNQLDGNGRRHDAGPGCPAGGRIFRWSLGRTLPEFLSLRPTPLLPREGRRSARLQGPPAASGRGEVFVVSATPTVRVSISLESREKNLTILIHAGK